MAPTDLFYRLKKYYWADAGTRPLFSSLALSPSFRPQGLANNVAHVIQQ